MGTSKGGWGKGTYRVSGWGRRGFTIGELIVATCVMLILAVVLCVAAGWVKPGAAPVAKGERRIGSVVSTATTVSGTTRMSEAAFAAITTGAGTANRPLVSMVNQGTNERYRAFEFAIASTAPATTAGTVGVYGVKRGTPPTSNGVGDYNLRYLGSWAYVVGSTTGAASGAVVDSTERLASTLVWTPATAGTSPPGINTYLTDAYKSAGVVTFSAADGVTPACTQVTDGGNSEWLLFDPATTAGYTLSIIGECGT